MKIEQSNFFLSRSLHGHESRAQFFWSSRLLLIIIIYIIFCWSGAGKSLVGIQWVYANFALVTSFVCLTKELYTFSRCSFCHFHMNVTMWKQYLALVASVWVQARVFHRWTCEHRNRDVLPAILICCLNFRLFPFQRISTSNKIITTMCKTQRNYVIIKFMFFFPLNYW